jgi:hypothetical protein
MCVPTIYFLASSPPGSDKGHFNRILIGCEFNPLSDLARLCDPV